MKASRTEKHPRKPEPKPIFRTHLFWGGFLFILSFALYFNTISHDYVLDDVFVTKENAFVQKGFSGIGDIVTSGYFKGYNNVNNQLYRPVVLITFAVEKALFGNDPHISHLFNVLLYAFSILLLFSLLTRLFSKQYSLFAFFVTLLFLAHPVHTEVVANIKSRDEILAFIFTLLTLIFILNYLRDKKLYHLIFSYISCFLCIMTKESGITILAVIPLILWFFSDLNLNRILLLSAPYLLIAGLYLLIRTMVLDPFSPGEESVFVLNNSLLGAKNTAEMLATNFVTLGLYLKLLVIPYPLSWDYSYNQIPVINWSDWKAISSLAAYLFLGIYALIMIRKKEIIAFGILFFFITLSVSSNLFVKIGSTFGERFLFVPSLGFCVVLVALLFKIPGIKHDLNHRRSKYIYAFIILITAAYAFVTFNRNKDWASFFLLAKSGVGACPNSARTQVALATEYYNLGKSETDSLQRLQYLSDAEFHFLKSIEIFPQYGDAIYGLGETYFLKGDMDKALMTFKTVITMQPDPRNALIYLSGMYNERKEWGNALECYMRLLKNDTANSRLVANIGAMHMNLRNYPSAIQYFEKSVSLDPTESFPVKNLILIYEYLGDKPKAAGYTEKLKRLTR